MRLLSTVLRWLQVVPLLLGGHKFRLRGFVCVMTEVGVPGLRHVYLYKQVGTPSLLRAACCMCLSKHAHSPHPCVPPP